MRRADREWMYQRLEGNYLNPNFTEKVDEFVELAYKQDSVVVDGMLKCPCDKCQNVPYRDPDTIKLHLYKHGFCPDYYLWTCHGESYFESNSSGSACSVNPCVNMVMDAFGLESSAQIMSGNDLEEDPHPEAKEFFDMLKNAEKPLYDGCKVSLLSAATRITNLKCEYNIPHRAIDGFTSLIKDICPSDNHMTETFYKTKKLLKGLELPYHKIDVCPKGCMLFWKENENLNACRICKSSRYKTTRVNGKHSPKMVLHYLPITPRLQRLYATKSTAEQMRWHATRSQQHSDVMIHPCDAEAWKHFDASFPSFASEPRNVRLGLSTDGFSPFGKSGKQYSCWPVIVTPYNLPPWLCMKTQFMFVPLIIPGPKSPKGNLDVFLQPLINELKHLWDVGVLTYDVSKKQNFNMKVALLHTISDFPGYGMLSGWSTAGKLACPYCMENTKSFTLKHGNKQSWFDCHRQFLPYGHAYRQNKSGFMKGKEETSKPPERLSGEQVWERVSMLPKTTEILCENPGHRIDGYGVAHHWTKQSIFWQLPYWSKLLIRHNLDVMHIEKNFFDNLFNTIMDVKGKTKDNEKARRDLKLYCKRRRLEVQDVHNNNGVVRTTIPQAPYVLTKEKRKLLCEWVKKLKFPDRYASNLGRCVDTKDYKLFGMKSHDCHVFMQRLLPVAFKNLLPLDVWNAMTEISQFFRDLCLTTLRYEDMVRLEDNIPEIICKLEKVFPPSFFNVMEHLPIHLPYEAKVGGPVQYRWMYCFERFLYHLKLKVGNKARVEGSIVKAILMEEISNFCTHYFEPHVDTKTNNSGFFADTNDNEEMDPNMPELFHYNDGYTSSEGYIDYLNDKDYAAAHAYVIGNCNILKEYESLFEEEIMRTRGIMNAENVWAKYQLEFPTWLKEYVMRVGTNDDVVRSLALGPCRQVRKFNKFEVNGFHFHTFDYGKNKSTMNYGLCVRSVDGDGYYGLLQEVIELSYVGELKNFTTILFKCDWIDPRLGSRVHDRYKLVDVNFAKKYPAYDPFVLSYQAEQVCFVPYPSTINDRNQWRAVFGIKARGNIDSLEEQMAFQEEFIDNPPSLSDPTELPMDSGENHTLFEEEEDEEDAEEGYDEESFLEGDGEESEDEEQEEDDDDSDCCDDDSSDADLNASNDDL